MSKEICISSTPHETRLAIIEDDQLTEVYYERENEYTLAGSIYKGRVTRVLPGMQSAFVDLGLERDAFLYVTDFLEEQEDSADFERVGGGHGREGRETPSREDQGGDRQARENREPPANQSSAAPPRVSEPRVSEGEDAAAPEQFEEGTRRWRGRRGRRGRSSRQQSQPQSRPQSQQGQPQQQANSAAEPLVAREPLVSSASRIENDRAGNEDASRRPQIPSFLPGESLSKYGRSAPQETAPPLEAHPPQQPKGQPKGNIVLTKPSTLIEEPLQWDGGGLLPGESISRHRGAGERAEAPLAAEEPHHEQVHEVAPAVEETSGTAAFDESSPAAEIPAFEESPAAAAVVSENRYEVEEPVEFEPENAAVSYRVDPSAPSEFRVAAPPAPVEIPVEIEDVPEDVTDARGVATEIPQEEIAQKEIAEPEPVAEPERAQEAEEQFPVLPEFERHFRPEPRQELANPVTPDLPASAGSDAEDFQDLDDLDDLNAATAGTGLLEEEEISEEEEYDFAPLYNHADDHDLEDMEEETLDQQTVAGAEIDQLVRDEHIDERIQGSGSALTGLTIDGIDDEIDDGVDDEVDDEADDEVEDEETGGDLADPDSGVDLKRTPAAAAAGQPARRERQDQRRGGRGNRNDGRRRHNGRRQTAQTSDLPIISELLKQGQEILVQIAKEPIAKKGARITSHIALPGRFLVFMPTVNHVGVSRKISSDDERQRLKRILISEKGTGGGGFIVRTAADGASEDDLRADIRFLISLWTEIKQRADESKAPALLYHDLNLVERVLRDQVSDNFSTIWVDNESEYERIVRFLNRFQPSLVRRVKLYTKETPLFEQFGIQEEIGKALKSKVWLKSGGSIVINQTEALVAIDINTGKYVGKTARLEDTIVKTNLDAIPEIVRQIRLRDLGGIIVIDFIDMDERKNRNRVMQALEEELKSDRAPSKVLQFNDFGLVAITRKRVRQSLERTLCVQCAICAGTGMVKSPTTICNEIYVEMRKMQRHLERRDVLLRVHPEVVKTLKGNNAKWLTELEEMSGKTIIVKSDPTLEPEQFDIQ
jgi:ribonuclease E